jgi:hypothetical protein
MKTKLETYLKKRIAECEAHSALIIAQKMETGDDDNFDVPYFDIRIKVYNEILELISIKQ